MKVRQLPLTCQKAYVIVDYMEQSVDIYCSEFGHIDQSNLSKIDNIVKRQKVKIEKQEPLKVELLDFLDSINNQSGTPASSPLVSGNEGLETVKLASAAIEKILKNGD